MTTCVINPLMMGAIPRQTYHEHGAKFMSDNDLMDEMKKQVQDSSYWSPTPTQALPTATTERSSRSALRALLQQPPPLSLVPDSRLESGTFPNAAIQPSWTPYPDQADFKAPNSLSGSKPFPQQYDTQSSDHQVGHQGFDLQPPTSNPYHANHSYRRGARQTQPVVGSVPFRQGQSDELDLVHRRQALQTERPTRPDFPVGSPRASSSLPKEFEKMQMMAFAQKQMREQMKNRLERRRSFDKQNQASPPKREGAGGSKLKFGITADGIPNGPDNHPMLHIQHPHPQQHQQPQQQQQLLFSRGFFPTANQLRAQDMHKDNRGSPVSSFSMETNVNVEDTEALVIKQFQEKVYQLDMGTRIGFQESLYRLARSARERQDSTHTSAEPDFAAMMDMDLDSCDRPTSGRQSRVQIETQTNPVDLTLMNMLFSPLPLPGLQSPNDHTSWSRSRAVAAASSQGNWCNWSTPSPAASEHKIRKGSDDMIQAQLHGRDGSGAAALPEETTSRTFTPHMTWSGAPRLADYASPPPGSSPVDPSILNNRPASVVNLTYGGPVAHTARQLGGIHSSTTKPVDIRAPRRCDSQSSIASDLSNSPSHGGHILNYNNVGFQGPSSHSSPDAGSFVSDGRHIELAAGNHGMDGQHLSNQNFGMMNMNDDILGAALSIQNRGEVNQIDRFHQPESSAPSPNSNAKNVTVGFSPMLYDDGSHFQGEPRGRSLGNNSASTGMSVFDQRRATVSRNTVDSVAYTRSGSEFFQA